MFTFKLELETGEAAEPANVRDRRSGLAARRPVSLVRPGLAYRVLEVREGVLVVELE